MSWATRDHPIDDLSPQAWIMRSQKFNSGSMGLVHWQRLAFVVRNAKFWEAPIHRMFNDRNQTP
ncbi:hypothetical protein K227x_36560 [Rubripirellula lacrimiformis]|uniref:Uncharacterized protein n=1 Tax=Rubripirellula lacrimiformis TaxID=1930273 RepID=A0A517NDQ6_9BACT|nr:hypothetical protein K227x_36560 [Rubripirellula lacrimiformis]